MKAAESGLFFVKYEIDWGGITEVERWTVDKRVDGGRNVA